jgi:hypothetical protein
MSRVILLLPCWAFRAGYRVQSTFTFYDCQIAVMVTDTTPQAVQFLGCPSRSRATFQTTRLLHQYTLPAPADSPTSRYMCHYAYYSRRKYFRRVSDFMRQNTAWYGNDPPLKFNRLFLSTHYLSCKTGDLRNTTPNILPEMYRRFNRIC